MFCQDFCKIFSKGGENRMKAAQQRGIFPMERGQNEGSAGSRNMLTYFIGTHPIGYRCLFMVFHSLFNAHRPVNLLKKQYAVKSVRESHIRKGEEQIRPLFHGVRKSAGASD